MWTRSSTNPQEVYYKLDAYGDERRDENQQPGFHLVSHAKEPQRTAESMPLQVKSSTLK